MTKKPAKDSTYRGKQFIVDGKPLYVFSGEFHYFRTPRALWGDRVLKCRRMLLNTLASYVPWNWHERRPGQFDFEGERDIAHFADEIAAHDLFFLPRPGPYICSEWDSGSVPQWLQHDTLSFRTTEPEFLRYTARWYDHVNPIFVSRLRSRGGNVIIYQVENEDWWCDVDYDLRLYAMAREDGIDSPIISNENPKNRGTGIIDTLDDYPLPWQPNSPYMFIPDGMEGKIRKLLETQPNKPPMHTEFETGWYQEFGQPAPSKWLGDVPAEWIEVLLKSAVSQGINAINMYMIAGGHNPGYWGSKNCTTTRDWIAPVHEWGTLNDSFYSVRRVGGMLMTLGRDLVEAEVDDALVQGRDEVVSVFARRGAQSVFVCPRSLSAQTAEMRFHVPDVPGIGTLEFPTGAPYHLAGHSMAILPVNVQVSERVPTIVYSTAELFRLFESDEAVTLVAFGRVGQTAEMALQGEHNVSGAGSVAHQDGRTVITVEIGTAPAVVQVKSASRVSIAFVDQDTAGRTWEVGWNGGSIPLISNLYLLREDVQSGGTVQLSAEAEPGRETWLAVPALQAPRAARVNGAPAEVAYDDAQGLATIRFPVEDMEPVCLDLSGEWRMAPESMAAELEQREWQPYVKWRGVEQHGLYDNGYFWYRTRFRAPEEPTPLTLRLTRFWDEAAVYVNGQFVEAARNNLTCDVTPFCRFGEENELVVVVECWGRWEHGFAEETGLIGPADISSTREQVDLRDWKRLPVETYAEPWKLTSPQPEAAPDLDDAEWKPVQVDWNWDSRVHGRWRGKEYYWYRTRVEVPASFEGRRITLDVDDVRDDCWLYVNGKFVRWLNWFRVPGEPFSVDVTDYVEPGRRNTIAVLVLVKWHGQGGLHRGVRLTACDGLLDGDWQVSAGTLGLERGYAAPELDDSAWATVKLDDPVPVEDEHGIVWLRRAFDLDLPAGWNVPLGLTVRGFEKKANIYLNGHFLGRYRSEGPQECFYVPDSWLKVHNVVVVALDGWQPGLGFGTVGIESYPITRQLEVEIEMR